MVDMHRERAIAERVRRQFIQKRAERLAEVMASTSRFIVVDRIRIERLAENYR